MNGQLATKFSEEVVVYTGFLLDKYSVKATDRQIDRQVDSIPTVTKGRRVKILKLIMNFTQHRILHYWIIIMSFFCFFS